MRHVSPRVIEPGVGAGVAVKVLGLLDAAQRKPRRPSRFVRRHAPALELVFEQRNVSGELAREIILRAAGTQDVHEPREEPPKKPIHPHVALY